MVKESIETFRRQRLSETGRMSERKGEKLRSLGERSGQQTSSQMREAMSDIDRVTQDVSSWYDSIFSERQRIKEEGTKVASYDPEKSILGRILSATEETKEKVLEESSVTGMAVPESAVEKPKGLGKPVTLPKNNAVAMEPEELESIIRSEAELRNMDPDVAVSIWKNEGGGAYQSTVERKGKGSLGGYEASFGPFQLFIGGGLGNDYERLTGRKLVNDNTKEGIQKQIQFSLDMAVKKGWTPWYGRGPAGVGERQGLENAVVANNWKAKK